MLYDYRMKASPRLGVSGVIFLLVPLVGCLGFFDMFGEKRVIAGDYFLMEGEQNTTDDLYLFAGDSDRGVAGPLNRIGWDQKYIIFTAANAPTQWNVITVKEHREFTVTDNQRTQDSRLQQIAISSPSEAWQRAKTQNPN